MSLLQQCRKKGMTLSELSEKTDISIVYLSNLNTGNKKNPSLDILEKISDTLQITLDELKDSLKN